MGGAASHLTRRARPPRRSSAWWCTAAAAQLAPSGQRQQRTARGLPGRLPRRRPCPRQQSPAALGATGQQLAAELPWSQPTWCWTGRPSRCPRRLRALRPRATPQAAQSACSAGEYASGNSVCSSSIESGSLGWSVIRRCRQHVKSVTVGCQAHDSPSITVCVQATSCDSRLCTCDWSVASFMHTMGSLATGKFYTGFACFQHYVL